MEIAPSVPFVEMSTPTQATKLTKEYRSMADDRSKMNVKNEVKMQRCILCNTWLVPEHQIEWALRRIEEKIPEYKNLGKRSDKRHENLF